MKSGHSDITVILDRSSSMGTIRRETIDGFNNFLRDQKAVPGSAHLTLVTFNHIVDDPVGRDLMQMAELTMEAYVPSGYTALYDAVGQSIDRRGKELEAMPEHERPEKVIFAILTDGEENSSHQYSHSRVAEMIQHQQDKYNWAFIFLGANMDAKQVATAINIPANNAVSWEATSAGAHVANRTLSHLVTSNRR